VNYPKTTRLWSIFVCLVIPNVNQKKEGKKLMKFNKFDLEAKALKKEQERQSNAINYSDELVTLLFNPRPTEEARKNGTK
tara:strand:- start:3261 stop:3500 length:240 start_codon:yes stop_codon:yes gene_type:complete